MMKEQLFQEFSIKNVRFKNRFVMAPMTRNFSQNGVPHLDAAEYYSMRARGRVGLIITEGVEISHPSSSGYPGCPNLISDESKRAWEKVITSVHKEDTKIFCQLWHVGGIRKPGMYPDPDVPGFTPSGIVKKGKKVAHEMSLYEIEEMIEVYANDAKICEDLGFDGVEIHGAHGYLIDQFFWGVTNQRTDNYGGNFEKRINFAKDIISSSKKSTSDNFIVGIRFSQWKQQDYEAKIANNIDELNKFISELSKSDPDFFHTSMRRFWEPEFESSNLNLSACVKQLSKIPVIAVGSVGLDKDFIKLYEGDHEAKIGNFDKLFNTFENDSFDMIAIGRALLSDPNLIEKLENSNFKDMVPFDKRYVEKYV